jgi:hypothetical protein
MMRARLSKLARGKKGQILTLALLVMFVGAIILGGLFMYMDSSLSLTIKSEDQSVNYYAADSGVEDAIAWLQHEPWSYPGTALAGWEACNPLDPDEQPCLHSYNIGNRSVSVSVVNPIDEDEAFGNNTFKITSNATSEKGTRITIESYVGVKTLDLYKFGADAITSNCDCDTCSPPSDYSVEINGKWGEIQGNISYVCSIDCTPTSKPCAVNGTINPPYTEGIPWWPDTDELLYYLRYMAMNAGIFTEEILYVDNAGIGPLYIDGDLEITNKGVYVYPFLDGIVYVDGDLELGTEQGDFTLNLSNQTIFAEGNIDVGGKVTLTGSGSIIALGDIKFAPQMDSGENDFLFILSVSGEVDLQPGGKFWGSVAADGKVSVAPKDLVGHRDPNQGGFIFPGIEPIFDIITYNITKFE